MNYHNITKDDMNNGDGLRAVLWLAGCDHHCYNCQNPVTWNPKDGVEFDDKAKEELFDAITPDYISGVTFSGGDPLHENNRYGVASLIREIRSLFPQKTVWIYTGYTIEEILRDSSLKKVVDMADVLVEGRYADNLRDVNYHWAGSTNQRVIDINKSKDKKGVVLHECN